MSKLMTFFLFIRPLIFFISFDFGNTASDKITSLYHCHYQYGHLFILFFFRKELLQEKIVILSL